MTHPGKILVKTFLANGRATTGLPLFRAMPPRQLSPTEYVVFTHLVQGKVAKEICAQYDVQLQTVKELIANILRKTGVRNTVMLIARYGVREPNNARLRAMLTPTQQKIVDLLAQGKSNQAMATARAITPDTVKGHIRSIMDRTNIRRRHGLVLLGAPLPNAPAPAGQTNNRTLSPNTRQQAMAQPTSHPVSRVIARPIPLFRTMPPRNLTPTEYKIFTHLVQGAAAKDICAQFNLALSTSIAHRRNIYKKTGIHKAAALVAHYAVHDPKLAALRDQLTPRQRQIVDLVARGLTNQKIGTTLNIKTHTIKEYVKGVMKRTGLERRAGFVHLARPIATPRP